MDPVDEYSMCLLSCLPALLVRVKEEGALLAVKIIFRSRSFVNTPGAALHAWRGAVLERAQTSTLSYCYWTERVPLLVPPSLSTLRPTSTRMWLWKKTTQTLIVPTTVDSMLPALLAVLICWATPALLYRRFSADTKAKAETHFAIVECVGCAVGNGLLAATPMLAAAYDLAEQSEMLVLAMIWILCASAAPGLLACVMSFACPKNLTPP
jgi:hypothetical protein